MKNFAIKVASLFARAVVRSITVVIYREQESSDEFDIMPRRSRVRVDNLAVFRSSEGVVNDYDDRRGDCRSNHTYTHTCHFR